jgi:LysR family transcriptional regulator, nod-box dependent transcriptional activator
LWLAVQQRVRSWMDKRAPNHHVIKPYKDAGKRAGTSMNLRQFDLNLLRALDALLSEQNVTRAAERLFVTQQAMSGSLGRLRDHFGDELLVRVGRSLELTPLGRALVTPVREALLTVEAALQTTPYFDAKATQAEFRVAMSDYASFVLLPYILRHLSEHSPGITCVVESIESGSVRKLEYGDLDFCIAPAHWELISEKHLPPEIKSCQLFEEDFVCVADPANLDAHDRLTLEQYASLTHNLLGLGSGTESLVERTWRLMNLEPKIAARAPSFAALIFMIPHTNIITTAHRRLAEALAPALDLKIVECPLEIPPLREDLAWHERHAADPLHIYLRESIQYVSRQLSPHL